MDLSRGGISVGNDNQGIDLEICELGVNVDSVESRDEVNEDVVYTLGNFLEESGGDLIVRWVFGKINWDQEFLGFGIDITNINTSLVCEENPVTLEKKRLGQHVVSVSWYFDWTAANV